MVVILYCNIYFSFLSSLPPSLPLSFLPSLLPSLPPSLPPSLSPSLPPPSSLPPSSLPLSLSPSFSPSLSPSLLPPFLLQAGELWNSYREFKVAVLSSVQVSMCSVCVCGATGLVLYPRPQYVRTRRGSDNIVYNELF